MTRSVLTRSARVLALVAALAAVGGIVAAQQRKEPLPFYRSAALTPEWLTSRQANAPSLHRIAPFAFVDQRGRAVTNSTVRSKVYVASFFFTTCKGLCPNLYLNLERVQTSFAADSGVMIVSHSVTPEIDTPKTLAQYAAEHHIVGDQWRLVTGDRRALRTLAQTSYFVALGDTTGNANGSMLHTETFVLIDEQQRIRGVYDGSLGFDTERLIEDIRVLRGMR